MRRSNVQGLVRKSVDLSVIVIVLLSAASAYACVPADTNVQACPSAFSNAGSGLTKLQYNVVSIVNGSVAIEIINGSGGIVKAFSPGVQGEGCYEQPWDGTDSAGVKVPEGTYIVKLKVANATENVTRTCSVIVDNTAPSSVISFSKQPGPDGMFEAGVTFSLDGSDSGSGISYCKYNINSEKEWHKFCSPVPLSSPGTYTIQYKVVDNAGNYQLQAMTIRVAGSPTAVPTQAPTATPTPAPTTKPTETPKSSPTPVPGSWKTFDVDPASVQTHSDGRITFLTGTVSSTAQGRTFEGSVEVDLTHVPASGGLNMYIRDTPDPAADTQFKLAATGTCGDLKGIACVLVVDRLDLQNGADIASATITMKVSGEWVDANGGAGAVKILRYSDGRAEALETRFAGVDGDLMVFEAASPDGLSEFALAAVAASSASTAGSPEGAQAGMAVIAGVIVVSALLAMAGASFVVLWFKK